MKFKLNDILIDNSLDQLCYIKEDFYDYNNGLTYTIYYYLYDSTISILEKDMNSFYELYHRYKLFDVVEIIKDIPELNLYKEDYGTIVDIIDERLNNELSTYRTPLTIKYIVEFQLNSEVELLELEIFMFKPVK